jgi:hypothetical protein
MQTQRPHLISSFLMFGNGTRTIFLFGVSSWCRRSVRPGTQPLLLRTARQNPGPAPPAAGFFLGSTGPLCDLPAGHVHLCPMPISQHATASSWRTRPTAGIDSIHLSASNRSIPLEGSAGLDRSRYRCAFSLLRAPRRKGDSLRRDRGRGCASLVRRRESRSEARMAKVDADGG